MARTVHVAITAPPPMAVFSVTSTENSRSRCHLDAPLDIKQAANY